MNYQKNIVCSFVVLIAGVLNGQRPIEVPEMIKVSVDLYSGNVTVSWLPTITSGIDHYNILKAVPGIDPPVSWTDMISGIPASGPKDTAFRDDEVFSGPRGYVAQACESTIPNPNCSNQDIYPIIADSTMYLTGYADSCYSQVVLNWNDYNRWHPDSTEYRVYRTIDSSLFVLEAIIAAGTEQAQIPIQEPNKETVYLIAALRQKDGRTDSASSTSILLDTEFARNPGFLNADYATYSGDGSEISFTIDPLSELRTYNILRSNTPAGVYDSIIQINSDNHHITIPDRADYLSGPYYYKIVSLNYCNQPTDTSNAASTILLSASAQGLEVVLDWNEYFNWLGGVENYTIARRIGQSDFEIVSTQNTTGFTDISIENPEQSGMENLFCYYVTATEGNSNPHGIIGTSRSNEVCIEIPPNIRFEYNAFTPGEGPVNNVFGPQMDYAPADYVFQIFSRSGFVIYESTDPADTMWNGMISGKPAPQDAYTYIVQFKTPSGKKETIKGMVSVVYP